MNGSRTHLGLTGHSARPSTSRKPSHLSALCNAHVQQWTETYVQEAKAEKARQLETGIRLHEAVKDPDTNKLREILARSSNVDINARDREGRTALHVAAKLGCWGHLALLLAQKEAEVDAQDNQKETPLHLATMKNHRNCVEILLRNGAHTEIADERGHLPRYYAASFPQILSLFDNPRKAKKRSKYGKNVPENRTLPEEYIMPAPSPPPPSGMTLRLAETFRGSFWSPESDYKWNTPSIFELLYSQDEAGRERRLMRKKWIHLSATSETWTKDLAKSICADNGVSGEKTKHVAEFIARVFKEVDAEGPCRRCYFKRQSSSEKRMTDDEMFAIVLPVVDVDKRDYVELARHCHGRDIESQGGADDPTLGILGNTTHDPSLSVHLTRMLQLSNFHDQPLPRTLDQSYYEYLDTEKVLVLDSDQVMTRYIRTLKSKSLNWMRRSRDTKVASSETGSNENLLRPARAETSANPPETGPTPRVVPVSDVTPCYQPHEAQPTATGSQLENPVAGGHIPDDPTVRDRIREQMEATAEVRFEIMLDDSGQVQGVKKLPPDTTQDDHPRAASPASAHSVYDDKHEERDMTHHEPAALPEPDDLITVPLFWLFKIDADTILTLYPERWDKNNEDRLHDHLLSCVSDNKDIQDEDDNLNMNMAAELILKSCMSFEAKAFAQCGATPDAPDRAHDVQVTYSKAFSNSIADLCVQVTERFDALKNGMGSLSKDPGSFYRDVKEETKILIAVDDIIGEIGMIKRVLLNQAGAFKMFCRAIREQAAPSDEEDVVVGCLLTFGQLDAEAERVRSMVTTLLDLRQREASIEDALSLGEQSTMLFIFTAVTVLFAPLSFVGGLLALNVEGLPDSWARSPLAEVFGLATLGTIGLCLFMWAVYKIYTLISVARRNRGCVPPPPPPRPAAPNSGRLLRKVAKILFRGRGGGGGGALTHSYHTAREEMEKDNGMTTALNSAGKGYKSWSPMRQRRQGLESEIEKGTMGV